MRILFDHNTPVPLLFWLTEHQVETAYERGWAELTNGELLRAAEESGFDLMITTDQGIRYEQNLAGRRLALLVLSTNDWTRIRRVKRVVLQALTEISAGSYVKIEIPFR